MEPNKRINCKSFRVIVDGKVVYESKAYRFAYWKYMALDGPAELEATDMEDNILKLFSK